MSGRPALAATARAGAFVLLGLALSSCAYYNTFYLARKYHDRATGGLPYVIEKPETGTVQYFTKSIDYSKKVIQQHPRSKWVDDAYVLWARGLMGRDDPQQAIVMLSEFDVRYPQSPLKDEARFYLGVAGRKARQYPESRAALEEFLRRQPRHPLAPYAYLELTRVLTGMERPGEGADAASRMLELFPGHRDRDRALLLRAEALLLASRHAEARADYKTLGTRALSDEQRFAFLLKEADCLEGGRLYDEELALLHGALGFEQEPQRLQPVPLPTTISSSALPGQQDPRNPALSSPTLGVYPMTPSNERWGRLMLRIGTVHTLAGRQDDALTTFRRVRDELHQTALAAEAQYRLGYVYEALADDLNRAAEEYGRVAKIPTSGQFAAQASQRVQNLERMVQFRSASGEDSLARKSEAGFMLAELYLFQNNKPERALDEYRRIVDVFPGTAFAGKALNAQAWVLRNKLERAVEADSLLWIVVHRYPKTEAQLHARDYLEAAGHLVPDSLIQPPDPPPPPPADTTRLTPLPALTDSLGRGGRRPLVADSLARLLLRAGDAAPGGAGAGLSQPGSRPTRGAMLDSLFEARGDTTGAPADTLRARADTTRVTAPADTVRAAPADSTREDP